MQREMEQRSGAPSGRFAGIRRDYTVADVERLSGSIRIEHTLARRGAERLWQLLQHEEPVRSLGAVTGNQAMQMVRAGLRSIYLSGWQVAADNNKAGSMYPGSEPLPERQRAPNSSGASTIPCVGPTRSRSLDGEGGIDWFVPIVADAEAGFGRRPERVRNHPGLHRSRRRGHPHRRPARFREEVRAYGG